jgi:FemAB-related protein (PEP-CTERM system-associated)
MSMRPTRPIELQLHAGSALPARFACWEDFLRRGPVMPLSRHPGWLRVLQTGLGHYPYCLEARENGYLVGVLPLALVESFLFGRFLVSLPYLNSAGVVAMDDGVARLLLDAATMLADDLEVDYLELRHEKAHEHPRFNGRMNNKIHLRLTLPKTIEQLWRNLHSKVRNQIRKAQGQNLTVAWGDIDQLSAFHDVFSRNMRDLGTPVYGRSFFLSILKEFPERAEICVVRGEGRPLAAALLLHGWGVTEVPSASSLRHFNHTNANMLLYWHLLQRAVERGQKVFDFGRSNRESNNYRFKKQWGALPEPAEWQYFRRTGSLDNARPDNPRYQRLIRLWQMLPLELTRLLGPLIVRGIP